MPSPDADTPQVAVAAPPKKRKKAKTTPVAPPTRATTAELRADTALVSRLREAVMANVGPDGWTHLSAVGSAIRKHPAVVLKTYGYSRLKDLMVATDLFELQRNGSGTSGPVHARVK
ncbi:OST-HTH/LOTUS domain-containing protein [Parafrankia sp. FMc6]|uniref:OST-HTH/LOTUS domain-containing protein n=1 Tax=Parafrankia soli TaxID=2599596 RepID=UPI0034D676E6